MGTLPSFPTTIELGYEPMGEMRAASPYFPNERKKGESRKFFLRKRCASYNSSDFSDLRFEI